MKNTRWELRDRGLRNRKLRVGKLVANSQLLRIQGTDYLRILKPLRDGGLPEAAEPGEGGVLAVEGD